MGQVADFCLVIVVYHVPYQGKFHWFYLCHALIIQSGDFKNQAINQHKQDDQVLEQYLFRLVSDQ